MLGWNNIFVVNNSKLRRFLNLVRLAFDLEYSNVSFVHDFIDFHLDH